MMVGATKYPVLLRVLASIKNTHAFVLTGILDKSMDFFILHLILDRSHLNIWYKAVAHPMCTSELGQDFDKRFIEGLRSINTLHSNTYLARIAHGVIKNTHCRSFEVSIIQQNRRVIATKLKRNPLKRLGGTCKDTLTSSDRASKSNFCDSWMLGHPATQLVPPASTLSTSGRESFPRHLTKKQSRKWSIR